MTPHCDTFGCKLQATGISIQLVSLFIQGLHNTLLCEGASKEDRVEGLQHVCITLTTD